MSYSSAETLWACLPPHLGRPLRSAMRPGGSAEERVGRRLLVLEDLVRGVLAVLASEARLLGVQSPKLRSLARKAYPSIGTWGTAIIELATLLRGRQGLVVPELPGLLVDEAGRWTQVAEALDALRELRNQQAHGRLSASPAFLIEDINGRYRQLRKLLAPLAARPIVVAELRQRYPDADEVALQIYRGEQVDALIAQVPRELYQRVPFIVGEAGQVLPLGPWLVAQPNRKDPILVYDHWDDGPCYRPHAQRAAHRFESATDFPGHLAWWNDALSRDFKLASGLVEQVNRLQVARTPELNGIKIGRMLGKGANGRVYLGNLDGEEVAVKVLEAHLAADATSRRRLEREYTLLRRLNHPAIVKVVDLQHDAVIGPWIAMEFVPGGNLAQKVSKRVYEPQEACLLMDDILSGLVKAHGEGVIHRDLKPQNVLLDEGGKPRLVDFGIATASDLSRLTATRDALGTFSFAAPEQIDGQKVDVRADIFSAGRLLGFMLSNSTSELEHRAAMPEALQAVYRRATSPQRRHRIGSAAEFRALLKKCVLSRFGGPPIQVGEVLAGQWVVEGEPSTVQGDWWAAQAVQDGRRAHLLLATSKGAKSLSQAAEKLPRRWRNKLGLGHPNRESDGRLWVLVTESDGPTAARVLQKALLHDDGQPLEMPDDEGTNQAKGGRVPAKESTASDNAAAAAVVLGGVTAAAVGAIGLGVLAAGLKKAADNKKAAGKKKSIVKKQ